MLPPLDACGFIRVPGAEALWMTCEQCKKSDHFWLDGGVNCRCGARYDHAVRPDGSTVPASQLSFVPFDLGPVALRDMEWDPRRLVLVAAVLLAVAGAAAWWIWG